MKNNPNESEIIFGKRPKRNLFITRGNFLPVQDVGTGLCFE